MNQQIRCKIYNCRHNDKRSNCQLHDIMVDTLDHQRAYDKSETSCMSFEAE